MPKTSGSTQSQVVIKGVSFAGPGRAAVYYYVNGVENSLRKLVVRGKGDKGPFTVAWEIAKAMKAGKTKLVDGNKTVDLLGDQFLYVSKRMKAQARSKKAAAKKAAPKQNDSVLILV